MKKIITISMSLLLAVSFMLPQQISAQSPEKMSYQAVVRDGSDNLVTSSSVGMQISILQGSSNGTQVYVETHTPTSNTNGLVSIEIGTGVVLSGDFSSIEWGDDTYFIQSEIDPDGGTNYTITGVSQLLSVPYSLYAKTAENVINDEVDDADNDPTNELQEWSTLPNIPADFADNVDDVDDADADPTNELQTLSRSGSTISLSNGGGSFTDSVGINVQGATPGDLLYWDGVEWAIVPVGSPGQTLQLNVNGIPEWMGSGYATVTTDPVSNIGAVQADFSGDVTSDGGSMVTERGFVYATDPSPNLTDDVEIVGSGTGPFSASISGLSIGQTYYVRAYATNSSGTVYGNEVSFQTNSTFSVGDPGPAGGLVFYDKGFYSNGWRYMEANPADLSTGTDWGCSGTLIPGSQPSAIENGPQNTQDIVANCSGTNIAARLCDTYSLNGFNDWFLPARQELDQMYINLHTQGLGSFNGLSTYWSSTENNNISAQGVSFNSGNTINNNKNSSYRVRAARRF